MPKQANKLLTYTVGRVANPTTQVPVITLLSHIIAKPKLYIWRVGNPSDISQSFQQDPACKIQSADL